MIQQQSWRMSGHLLDSGFDYEGIFQRAGRSRGAVDQGMWCLNELSFLLHTALVFHQKKAIKLLPLQP